MRQHVATDGKFDLREHLIEEFERPPIIGIESYREKFHPSATAGATP
jgi:hypothetical protein